MKLFPITIPGGSDTHFQYNNGGIFGGSAHAVINDATGVSTFTGATVTGGAVISLNSAIFQPTADADNFFQVNDKDGNRIITGDTVNNRLGIHGQIVINSGWDAFFIDGGIGSAPFFSLKESGTTQFRFWTKFVTDELLLLTNTGVGRQYVFTDYASRNSDHDHTVQTNPTLYIHSATDPNDDNTQWLSLTHDQTNAVFTAGLGTFRFKTSAPTIDLYCPTHNDADDAAAGLINFVREDGAGTESTAATITGSHDGAGANDTKGKLVIATDSGAGLVDAVEIDSDQITHIGDGTNEVQITHEGVQTFHGNARFWQGVVLDTSRFKEPPAHSATLVNRGIGTAYKFTKDQENEHLHAQISIPGFWDVSGDIQVILFWDTPVTSDDCDWEIHYQFRAYDEALDSEVYDGVVNSSGATSSATSKGLVHTTVVIPTASFDTGDKMLRLGIYRDGVTDSIDDFVYLHGMRVRGVRNKTGGAM